MEKWKEIKGYESGYLISNYGNVKSLKRFDKLNRVVLERILKTEKTKKGYLRVSLSNKNGVKKHLVHRLVALHFIENSLSRLLNNIPTIKNGKKYYQKKIKGYKWKFYDTDK